MPTVFERLLSGEWPSARVYEDAHVFAFMDAGQVNDGHVIVATRRPVVTLMDCSDDEAAALIGVDAQREWVVHFATLGWPA
jgi:histidine triad (HIT) family protein